MIEGLRNGHTFTIACIANSWHVSIDGQDAGSFPDPESAHNYLIERIGKSAVDVGNIRSYLLSSNELPSPVQKLLD